jgi:hypothetical protein
VWTPPSAKINAYRGLNDCRNVIAQIRERGDSDLLVLYSDGKPQAVASVQWGKSVFVNDLAILPEVMQQGTRGIGKALMEWVARKAKTANGSVRLQSLSLDSTMAYLTWGFQLPSGRWSWRTSTSTASWRTTPRSPTLNKPATSPARTGACARRAPRSRARPVRRAARRRPRHRPSPAPARVLSSALARAGRSGSPSTQRRNPFSHLRIDHEKYVPPVQIGGTPGDG